MGEKLLGQTSFEGFERLGTGDELAVEQWELIDAFFRQEESSGGAIALLAEPVEMGASSYSWYADAGAERTAVPGNRLSDNDFGRLAEVASRRLKKLRAIASAAAASNERDRREIGRLLVLAVEHPLFRSDRPPSDASLRDYRSLLHDVGGEPVLTNWGARALALANAAGEFVIREEEAKPPPPPPPPPRDLTPVLGGLLWAVFAVISTAVFTTLVAGCGTFLGLGLGPNFCLIRDFPGREDLIAEQERSEMLMAELRLAQDQIIEAPRCDAEPPRRGEAGEVGPVGGDPRREEAPDEGEAGPADEDPEGEEAAGDSEDPLPPDVASGDAESAASHRELNDLLRAAGGGVCEGVELLAIWEGAADIDLRLYCPLEDGEGEVPADRIVDAFGPEGCGAVWDVGSSGEGGDSPHLERICLGAEADVGEYLVTLFHDAEADVEAVPVRVVLRRGNLIDEQPFTSVPGAESEEAMVVEIEDEEA